MNEQAYCFWYEFLRRSSDYRKCCFNGGQGRLAALYQDFGDVHQLAWEQWWAAHRGLFTDIEPRFITNEIYTKAAFCELFDDDEPDFVGLIINLAETKKSILEEVAALITRLQRERLAEENRRRAESEPNRPAKRKRGRPKFDPSFHHRYGLAAHLRTEDIGALDKTLRVYDACLLEDNKGKGETKRTRFEIGVDLGISPEPSQKRLANESSNLEDLKRRMTATVCRYNRWAKQIIINVEQGIFPKHGK